MSDKPDKKHSAPAYFCPETGKRLVKAGVSRDVDPKKGVDDYDVNEPDKSSSAKGK